MCAGEPGRLALERLARLSSTERAEAWVYLASAPTPSRTDVERAARSLAATGEFFCTRCLKHTGDPNLEFFHWGNDQTAQQHKMPKLRSNTAAPPHPDDRVLQVKYVERKSAKKRPRVASDAGCEACAAERHIDAEAELLKRPLKVLCKAAAAFSAPAASVTPRGRRIVYNRPLTTGEEAIANEYLVDELRDPDDVINELDGTPVSRLKIRCLIPTEELNDEVVNFFMGLLRARGDAATEEDALPRCHFFTSMFYTKLCYQGEYKYADVKRWTDRRHPIDVFAKDLLICPIHCPRPDTGDHWTLAVVNLLEKRFEYFDSLRGNDGGVLANLRRYMMDEHLDKKNASWDDAGWTDHTWHAGTPRQRNGWDCAVFMCKTADYYAQDARLDFSQDDMDYFRRRLALEIHNKTLLT